MFWRWGFGGLRFKGGIQDKGLDNDQLPILCWGFLTVSSYSFLPPKPYGKIVAASMSGLLRLRGFRVFREVAVSGAGRVGPGVCKKTNASGKDTVAGGGCTA